MGSSAMHLAAQHGHQEVVDFLCQEGADHNSTNVKVTLHWLALDQGSADQGTAQSYFVMASNSACNFGICRICRMP